MHIWVQILQYNCKNLTSTTDNISSRKSCVWMSGSISVFFFQYCSLESWGFLSFLALFSSLLFFYENCIQKEFSQYYFFAYFLYYKTVEYWTGNKRDDIVFLLCQVSSPYPWSREYCGNKAQENSSYWDIQFNDHHGIPRYYSIQFFCILKTSIHIY